MSSGSIATTTIPSTPMSIESIEDHQYHNSFLAMVERNQIPLSRNLLIILYLSHLLLQNNNTTITHIHPNLYTFKIVLVLMNSLGNQYMILILMIHIL